MKYDEGFLDQVRQANDIVDVISGYIPLKRAGRNFKAPSPFKQEKTPSFFVSPEKQIFHCFSSHIGGDVFAFLMHYEHLTFPEAVRRLAERAHIPVPETKYVSGSERSEKEKIYEMYEKAAQFYRKCFLNPHAGAAARDYLFQKRQFTPEAAEMFQVGCAPSNWQGLYDFLRSKGFSDELMIKARLVSQSEKGRIFDLFRNRLLFPIHSIQGKVVAFGGRVLSDSDGPKYLNSPENPIFYKRRELFGLHLAKRHVDREYPRIIVVEGYLDFLRLFGAGFKATVATLGTALSSEHVRVLKRFAEEAVVVYDGDKAGISAALRGMEVFLEEGMGVKLILLPQGMDPDDFVRTQGAEAFQKLLDRSQDFFDFKLQILMERYNARDTMGLMRIINDLLETLVKVENPILVDRYLKSLSGALAVDENSLRSELLKSKKRSENKNTKSEEPAGVPEPQAAQHAKDEIMALGLMIDQAAIRNRALADFSEDDFEIPELKQFFRELGQMNVSGQPVTWPLALDRIHNDSVKNDLAAIASFEWALEDQAKAYEDCRMNIKRKKIESKLTGLRQKIAELEKQKKLDELTAVMKEYQDLLKQKKAIV